MPKITAKFIEEMVTFPASGQLIIRDDELKGFGLRVTKSRITFVADYTSTTNNPDFGSQFMVSNFLRGSAQFVITGFHSGPSTVGTLYSVTVSHPALPNGQKTVTYTTVLGDTYASVASGVSAVFNADTNIQSIGLSSSAASQTVTATPTFPTYTGSTSGGATETLTPGQTYEGQGSIAVGGTVTTGDVLSIIVHYPGLTGLQETVSYTVLAADTLASIATGLAAALNADAHLQAIDLTSSTVSPTILTSAKTFKSNPTLPLGSSSLIVSAIDGGSNTKSNGYQISTKGSANQPLTYDRNGNMTGDGTNTYLWDAENRLVQINYSGTGNTSQFTYDGLGRNVGVMEATGGTITSTQQFIWAAPYRREARNASGAVISQYFTSGEKIAGSSYFLAGAYDGSVREVTDSSAVIQAQLTYDLFGRVTQVKGTLSPDFEYCGYFVHSRSGLSLTRTRCYSAALGRFINRDPLAERSGNNLFCYVNNNPINYFDPSGLQSSDSNSGAPVGPMAEPGTGANGGTGTPLLKINASTDYNDLTKEHGVDTAPDPSQKCPRPPCVHKSVEEQESTVTREGSSNDDCKHGDGANNCRAPEGTIYTPSGDPICDTGPVPPAAS